MEAAGLGVHQEAREEGPAQNQEEAAGLGHLVEPRVPHVGEVEAHPWSLAIPAEVAEGR